MATGKSGEKPSSKQARQHLFSEALHHFRPPGPSRYAQPTNTLTVTDTAEHGTTMDHILQEITAVGHRMEGMDSIISVLVAETKSIRLDIAGFQTRVSDLEQCVVAVQNHLNTVPDRELLFLCSKLVDLEDKSHRDNIRFIGFPEHVEGAEVQAFLKETLPTLTGISFDPPLEFKRMHHLGPKRAEDSRRPCPIIACLLPHTQARQLISTACSQGPF
ncbi:hypothetical protein NDU88_007456 [Pleurodeles waltl]|uniref:Uncharacterized protein n=1 Tax=Pleurodeles waltl TaxID=8319 RepID=A0AAV7P280_PLEWA|nr:hypothetical protein NDU88_007456 [Pleurodeles waltl]